jgi:hypothetical protein
LTADVVCNLLVGKRLKGKYALSKVLIALFMRFALYLKRWAQSCSAKERVAVVGYESPAGYPSLIQVECYWLRVEEQEE